MRLRVERETKVMYEVLVRVVHDTSGQFSVGDVTERPCPAITIGVNGLNTVHYQVYSYLTNTPPRFNYE